ncbi:MAG: translation elongation factor Ts [Phycisphaerales bacterium]
MTSPTMDPSQVNAKDAMTLRQKTGLGIMDCKKALADAAGDMAKAEALLKERLKGKMDTRTDRAAGEGRVEACIDAGTAAIVSVRAETDFTARNDDFVAMSKAVAKLATKGGAGDVKATPEINAKIDEIRIKTGENLSFGTGVTFSGGAFAAYVHHDSKKGALVHFSAPVPADVGKGISQHIVAHVPIPLAVDGADMPADKVAEAKAFAVKEAQESGKPAQIAEKMAEGKMRKFLEENTLLNQNYVVDPTKKVKDLLPAGVKVLGFARMSLGETIVAVAKG